MFNCQHDYYLIFGIWMWILLRIWDLSLSFGQRSPVKGVFTKMEVRKFVQRLHGSYQNKVDKRPRCFSLFMANRKKIITTTKLTYRVSVFFFHIGNTWCDLFIYFVGSCCDSQLSLEIQFTVLSFCSFFMFMFFLRFLFFSFLMLAFQFRWKVLLLFFYFRIRYRYIFVASYSMIEQSSVCRFKRGAANVKKKVSYVFAMTM